MKLIRELQRNIKRIDEAIHEMRSDQALNEEEKSLQIAILSHVKSDFEEQLKELRAWN